MNVIHAAATVLAVIVVGAALAAPIAPQGPEARMQQGERAIPVASQQGFEDWVAGFRVRALARGISAQIFDAAFEGALFLPEVIVKDRNQAEFTKTIWDYLAIAVSDERVKNGKAALRKHRKLLDRIEAAYGVDRKIVVAIWGLESAYGEIRGSIPVIHALATLAYDGRRGAFFEEQLLAALKILQAGDSRPDTMLGSWAGAMGHTQFIPTSYLAFAQDFTGDGKRDIWSDNPADALASTAAYLAKSGWRKGRPWGVEVKLPVDFDFALSGERVKKSVADWAALGVRDMDGRTVADHGPASILLPGGARGAAFMIFANFQVIERYNAADAYVIGVGHLGDRITGGPAIRGSWPIGDRALVLVERQELQERLAEAGFDPGGVDGKIGPLTIAAVKAFQRSIGMAPDGYASLEILKRLR